MSTSMVIEPALGILFAASLDTKPPPPPAGGGNPPSALCVSIHSMSPEKGMLAYKYRMSHPSFPPGSLPPNRSPLSKVVSLHPLGRELRGCVGMSYGQRLAVFESHPGLGAGPRQRGPGDVKRARLDWQASAVGPPYPSG